MAFKKVLMTTLCLAAALAAPAPQTLLHAVSGQPTVVRAIPQVLSNLNGRAILLRGNGLNQQISHVAHHSEAPAVAVRTVAHPVPHSITHLAEEEEIEVVTERPQYNFGYSVADVRSGDSKAREETRDGDVVTGYYTVADPDGRVRRVEYTASKETGFQAHVTYDGEDGPVAIPTANSGSAASVVTEVAADDESDDDDVAIIAARDNLANEDEAIEDNDQIIQLVRSSDGSVLRAIPASTTVLSHGAAIPSVVQRTSVSTPTVVRSNAHHVVHNARAVTHQAHLANPTTQLIRLNGRTYSVPVGARFIQI